MFPISDNNHPAKLAIATLVIIALNIFVFVRMLTTNFDLAINSYGLIPSRINFSDPYFLAPFLTSMFLHGGFFHIFSNLWFLHIFGDNVEERLGFLRFVVLYFLSGLAGAFTQYLLNPASQIPIIGASAAISGVLGAYFSFFPHHNIKSVVFTFFVVSFINIPAGFYLLFWFVIQFFQGIVSIPLASAEIGGVAFAAHVGGFAAGFLLSKILDSWNKHYIAR